VSFTDGSGTDSEGFQQLFPFVSSALPDSDHFVQRRKVSQIFVEDSYNHLALDSDIAILALETPAVLSFYVRPACYPQNANSFLEE